ncbi:MAG: MerR family transcriptional regulator [Pseudomonadota bacterium]
MPRERTEKEQDAYRSIGEAAKQLGLPTHVLRYWETKFPRHIRPIKRPDGRRLYRKNDLDSLRAIQMLVHEKGMTLRGAKTLLVERGVEAVLGSASDIGELLTTSPVHVLQNSVETAFGVTKGAAVESVASSETALTSQPGSKARLEAALKDMNALKARLDMARDQRAA